jgi:hypothetical protein
MEQRIEPPNQDDVDRIARQLIATEEIVYTATAQNLSGSEDDLDALQSTLDMGHLTANQTFELQCLGLAFGRVILASAEGFDWAMVEDEYGRDPALRYKETELLVFPLTMISRRIEDGEHVELLELLRGLRERTAELAPEFH